MKGTLLHPQPDNMPIIRIAPVCNGKIYVVPHISEQQGTTVMDIPIQEYSQHMPTHSVKAVKRLKEKYHLHLQTEAQPRFSVKYKVSGNSQDTVYLYILPLKHEKEIHFHEGKFISTDEINPDDYSQELIKESELLGMAAELWKDYYQTIP